MLDDHDQKRIINIIIWHLIIIQIIMIIFRNIQIYSLIVTMSDDQPYYNMDY